MEDNNSTNPTANCSTEMYGQVRTADCASPFQLGTSNDGGLMDRYGNEALLIAGADINVFKLLGVHQQGKLTDLTGRGNAISSGGQPTYDAANVYDLAMCGEWRSMQRGDAVTQAAYIGYNFGEIKLDNGRNQYGITTYVQQHVTTIRIQQGEESINRVSKIRIEHSVDGVVWRGADIMDLPDTDGVVTLHFKQSVASKFWRIRPTKFNGGANDYWAVRALELIDLSATSITNIQDEWGFLENRDREYAKQSILLKGTYDMVDTQSFLARFGMETTDEFTLKFHFLATVASLGRPMVIGDILEIPSQVQYTPDMQPVKKYLEVTSVAWAVDGFTPGWKPIFVKVVAAPMLAKQETMDIVGDFAGITDSSGLFNIDSSKYSDIGSILNQKVDAKARETVPEKGEDRAHKPVIEDKYVIAADELGVDVHHLNSPTTNDGYVRDAMPPGSQPYTEGDEFPVSPKDGMFHRLTYLKIDKTIPTRLHRFSLKKNRWIYLETDERMNNTLHSMRIAEFLTSATKANINEVK